MRKQAVLVVTVFLIVCAAGAALLTKLIMTGFKAAEQSVKGQTFQAVKVTIPKGVNERSLAVFNFRPHGSSDTKYYAIGFARALADNINCAPTSLTQQMSTDEISSTLERMKFDPRNPISDEIAMKAGQKMGVFWIITGDFRQNGNKVSVSFNLMDTKASTVPFHFSADNILLSDLPQFHAKFSSAITQVMKLSPSQIQTEALSKPNFTKPETLNLYGQSFHIPDLKKCESLRWKAVQNDPQALFPILRLLEFYTYGPATGPETQSNKQLNALIAKADKQFPGNSHIAVLKGLLLAKQYKYADAQNLLQKLVQTDPDFIKGNSALGFVASKRGNGQLALAMYTRIVEMWPNNPFFHAMLAGANNLAADNARNGHYISNMTPEMSAKWKNYSENALAEATISVKMNPDCIDGWQQLMDVGLQLGRRGDREVAFNEMTRIDPKYLCAYTTYALGFLPQWYDSPSDLQRIYSKAESAFGKNSPSVYYLRATTMMNYPNENKPTQEILWNADQGLNACKTPDAELLYTKSLVLFGMKQYDESEKIAVKGLNRWGSLGWRFMLARDYTMRYQYKGDRDALNKAAKLFAEYSHELPFDPEGYSHLGWCQSHQGNREAAKVNFLKALELDPTNKFAREKLQYVQ